MPMSKKPYGPPPGEPGVDNLTYNPQADARSDNAAFDDNFNGSDMHPVGARGADNQPTSRNAGQEDREAEQSENSRQIPRSGYMRPSSFRTLLIVLQAR